MFIDDDDDDDDCTCGTESPVHEFGSDVATEVTKDFVVEGIKAAAKVIAGWF